MGRCSAQAGAATVAFSCSSFTSGTRPDNMPRLSPRSSRQKRGWGILLQLVYERDFGGRPVRYLQVVIRGTVSSTWAGARRSRSSQRWILLFFPNLRQNPDKYAGISPHPFPGQKRTPALLDQMGGLLAAAGKSDNLTYLQKHGVSSVWAPMLSAWSRGDCDTFSRQTPMRFSQSQSKPRRLKMDNKEPRCLLCSFLPPIERLEETLRMRSGGPKVRLQVSQ
jgi:hypothetical protein